MTVSVWVLVFFSGFTTYHGAGGGPAVIDNIATLAECQRLQTLVRETMPDRMNSRCIEVRKVK